MGNEPLTFEDTANMARGDKRLAALKADMDDMGVRVGQTVKDDPKYKLLKVLSRSLRVFFSETVQGMIEKSWRSIYTICAGEQPNSISRFLVAAKFPFDSRLTSG